MCRRKSWTMDQKNSERCTWLRRRFRKKRKGRQMRTVLDFFKYDIFLFLLGLEKKRSPAKEKILWRRKEFSKVPFFQLSYSPIPNSFTKIEVFENNNLIKINMFSLAELFLTSYAFFCAKFFPMHLIYSARFLEIHYTWSCVCCCSN